jgi:hypothetical protein
VELVVIGVLETAEEFVEEVKQLRCGLIGELRLGKPDGGARLMHTETS